MLSAQRVRHSQVYLLYPSGAVSSSSAPLAEVLAAPAGLQTGGSGPDTLIDLMVHESARHSCVRSRRQHAEGSRRLWRQQCRCVHSLRNSRYTQYVGSVRAASRSAVVDGYPGTRMRLQYTVARSAVACVLCWCTCALLRCEPASLRASGHTAVTRHDMAPAGGDAMHHAPSM